MKEAWIFVLLAVAVIAFAVEYTPPVAPTFSFTVKAVHFYADEQGVPETGAVDIQKRTIMNGVDVAPITVQQVLVAKETWLAALNEPLVLLSDGNVVTTRVAAVIAGLIDGLARTDNPLLEGTFADQIPTNVSTNQ